MEALTLQTRAKAMKAAHNPQTSVPTQNHRMLTEVTPCITQHTRPFRILRHLGPGYDMRLAFPRSASLQYLTILTWCTRSKPSVQFSPWRQNFHFLERSRLCRGIA